MLAFLTNDHILILLVISRLLVFKLDVRKVTLLLSQNQTCKKFGVGDCFRADIGARMEKA